MKIKEVFSRYRKLVPFPWNRRKIKCSGIDPKKFVRDFARELSRCDDQTAETALFCKKVKHLK